MDPKPDLETWLLAQTTYDCWEGSNSSEVFGATCSKDTTCVFSSGNWIAIGISEESEESDIRLIRHWLCLPKQPWEDWNRRARRFRGMSCCGELPFPQLTQFTLS